MKKIISHIEVLSKDEIQMIHDGSLEILESTGLKVPHLETLKRCEEAGAIVDYDKEMIRIPRAVIENLLDKNKNKAPSLNENVLQKKTNSLSTQSTLLDYGTGKRRDGVIDDVYKGICLVDQMETFQTTSSVVVPHDVPYKLTDLVASHALLSYAKKEGGTHILTAHSCKYILEMYKVLGREYTGFLGTVSPLQFSKESLEIAQVFVEYGFPIGLGSMVMAGSTGPVTVAGTLALSNSEILASIYVVYALSGKIIDHYPNISHSMDMRSMICSFGSPNQALFAVATAQLAKFYGLQGSSNSGLTDSLFPDFQGGMEKALTSMFGLLSGLGGTGAMGIVGADQGASFEQIVLDNEMYKWVNYIAEGIEVTEETLAIDIIKKVGCGGHYLLEEHTVTHMRDNLIYSKLFCREAFEDDSYSETLYMRAHQMVEELTQGYKDMEPSVSATTYDELTRIMSEGKKDIMGLDGV